jgi:hypothetical protein
MEQHRMNKKIFILFLFVYLVCACTASLPPVDDRSIPPQPKAPAILPAPEEKSMLTDLFGKTPKKDEELFNQGLRQIAEQAINQGEYAPARQTFATLITSYPESKWRDAAQVLLRLLDEAGSSRTRLLSAQTTANKLSNEKTRALQENEQSKKELHLLNEKYQADVAALQQENEQLKKDIQLLKNLEIQMDKREKQLR